MRFTIKITAASVLILGLVVGFWPGRSLAATGLIYLSPSSSSVLVGNDVTVALRINPGTTVNAVQATVNYNQADLQFVSAALSAFPTCFQDSGGGGVVTLVCTMLSSGTSSDSLIANITFKALVGSGSTALGISGGQAANNGTYTSPSSSGASVSFTSPPAPAPAPTPTYYHRSVSATTPSTTAAAPPTPAPVPSPTVTITSKLKTAQLSTATVTVSTNVVVQVYIEYGTDKNNLNQETPLSAAGSTETVSIDPEQLIPGTTYYYRAVSKDVNGKLTKGTIESFTTKGYTVSITVLDDQYRPLANKTVTLHSTPMTAKTDSRGVATFINVTPGLHHLEYVATNRTYSQSLYVNNDITTKSGVQTAAPQSDAVILADYQQPKSGLSVVELVLLGVAGLGLVGLIATRRSSIIRKSLLGLKKWLSRLLTLLFKRPKPSTSS